MGVVWTFLLSSIRSLLLFLPLWGWSAGAMVLGKLPVPGHPTIWMIVGQGRSRCGLGLFLMYTFSPLSPSLWERSRFRLKYCLKGRLNPKRPTNQPSLWETSRYRVKYCLKGPLNRKQPTYQLFYPPRGSRLSPICTPNLSSRFVPSRISHKEKPHCSCGKLRLHLPQTRTLP